MSTSTHTVRSYPFEGGCTEEMVSAELRKMLQSQVFGRSRRLRRFLRFSVEQTLLQQTENLKEYSIGLEVFEKPESFDPRMDSIVRVVARRLRMMVDRYYETDGANDETLIVFHSGSYVPHFRLRSAGAEAPSVTEVPADSPIFLVAGEAGVSDPVNADEIAGKLGMDVTPLSPERGEEILRRFLAGEAHVYSVRGDAQAKQTSS